jgi:murein DD-endopeptidase MepM/ murein hydrolase activator NlpD
MLTPTATMTIPASHGLYQAYLVLALLGALVFGSLAPAAQAASSSEILQNLNGLKSQQSEIQAQSDKLEQSIAANQSKTQTLVEKKSDIDQQLEMSRKKAENLSQQIQQYSLLISQKQDELDQSVQKERAMNMRYQVRLRAMEEAGQVSYWSILFKARSFADLLSRVDMIHEVAKADQFILKKISDMTAEIKSERSELESQKLELESAKSDLAGQRQTMETQRAQSDALILQMADEYAALSADYQAAEKQASELSAQIAKAESDYNKALSAEEAARIAALNQKNNNKVSQQRTSSGGSASGGGFLIPVASYSQITDAYGWRIHPVFHDRRFHTGIDFACGAGTEIYASKSGTVTTAAYDDGYGYYVTVNHGDGYSTLYGHMTNYIVSAGDYVKQGQVIGYVGTTGWSTGPHMHFGVYYNSDTVNPMEYMTRFPLFREFLAVDPEAKGRIRNEIDLLAVRQPVAAVLERLRIIALHEFSAVCRPEADVLDFGAGNVRDRVGGREAAVGRAVDEVRGSAHVFAKVLILRLFERFERVEPAAVTVFPDQSVASGVLSELRDAGCQNDQLTAVRHRHTRTVDGLVAEPGALKFGGVEVHYAFANAVLDKVDVLFLREPDSLLEHTAGIAEEQAVRANLSARRGADG